MMPYHQPVSIPPISQDVTHIPKDSGVRPIEVFMCSILKKAGYPDGFRCVWPPARRAGVMVTHARALRRLNDTPLP